MPSRLTTLAAACTLIAAAGVWVPAPATAAGTWHPALATGSHGEAQSQAGPAAPANPAAVCSGLGLSIKVSWSAVTHASTYTVYQSTTAATGPYSSVASGVTGTSWTSGILTTGNYWYEVTATVGSAWTSVKSAATAQRTITAVLCS